MKRLLVSLLSAVSLSVLSVSPLLAQDPNVLRDYYQQRLQTYEAELIEAQKAGPENRWQQVDILNGAGIAHRYVGQYQQAVQLHQQALDLARDIRDRGRERNALKELASSHSKLGDLEGIQFLENQLQTFPTAPKARSLILFQLGIAQMSTGNQQRGLEIFEEYLPLAQSLHEPQQAGIARTFLAGIYLSQKKYEVAIKLFQENLNDARRQKDTTAIHNALLALASAYQAQGNFSTAAKTYEELTRLVRQQSQPRMQMVAQKQWGALLQKTGDTAAAIKLFRNNIDLAKQANDPFWQAWSLEDLSLAYTQRQDYKQAIQAQKQGLALLKQVNASTPKNGDISEARALENLGYIYWQAGQLQPAEQALKQAIQSYTALRQQTLENANLFSMSRDSLNLNLREGLKDAYQLLQQILIDQGRTDEGLLIAEQSRAQATADLIQQSQPPITLEQMRQVARQQQTTIVQYSYLLKETRTLAARTVNGPQESRLFIWVIQPTGIIHFRQVRLGEAISSPQSLQRLVEKSRQSIGVVSRGVDWATQIAFRPTQTAQNQPLETLYQRLIDPIVDLLPSEPTAPVTFVPDGSLYLAPFAALKDTAGRYLLEQHTLLSAPSIQVLSLLDKTDATLDLQQSQALIVGNPTMPTVRLGVGEPLEKLIPLPGAEQEAKAVAKLLNTQPLIGSTATETAITDQIRQADLIHLATHGLLDSTLGLRSAVALTPTTTADGLLHSFEILNLPLQAKLVVLSACNTGRGRISGDGVVGLSRAFLGAGVPSLVVSLWAIPDDATAELMTAFYQNLQRNPDKAQALRQAMLTVKQTQPHPRDWAAFTFIGTPQ
ncbi:CHAT domain-containing tetratricopeptide repeat protein [Acaryochloris sp. IP29b_bin.137]|uniref:CHAT domain-containing tetratricopeptide repeat protein n=1 Tax=Acaryochloris sp. IP29b_bin.137 TaxID=2969217 RepID=UPI002607B93D|nr:CHAT domain-containing tetratricopeptide repeat protein [Acaryochloris sp. IP29b_bin.137]